MKALLLSEKGEGIKKKGSKGGGELNSKIKRRKKEKKKVSLQRDQQGESSKGEGKTAKKTVMSCIRLARGKVIAKKQGDGDVPSRSANLRRSAKRFEKEGRRSMLTSPKLTSPKHTKTPQNPQKKNPPKPKKKKKKKKKKKRQIAKTALISAERRKRA